MQITKQRSQCLSIHSDVTKNYPSTNWNFELLFSSYFETLNNYFLFCHCLNHNISTFKLFFSFGFNIINLKLKYFFFFQTSAFTIYAAIELYKTDLECVSYCRLPRYQMPKSFHDRGDGPFLHLLKECPYIHTLVSIQVVFHRFKRI